ncbi:MAG: TIGR04282 family arsenosugar biosynthesis glycosyltransferase [Ktedonobacterales bacterium]
MEHHIKARGQSLAIVMPALNEEGAIGPQITALRTHFTRSALPAPRILVVDNGSTDGTAHIARAAGAEVVSEPHRGYGYACLAGIQAAVGADVVLLLDADGSDDLAGAVRVAESVLHGDADLAVGSRTLGQVEARALTPQQRAGNAVGALLLRLLYGLRVSDIGPTRAIRRDALLQLDMREMGYGWSVEMLAKAARAGLCIHELPVDYQALTAGKSKVSGTLRGTLLASQHIHATLLRYRRWHPRKTPAGQPRAYPRRALFVVVRVPTCGMTKTRLGQGIGHDAATALYAAFVQDLGIRLTRAARRDGYDLYWFYTDPATEGIAALERLLPPGSTLLPQIGADLGERLLHGFRTLQARGYDEIAVLGSDSPHIPAAWIHEAFDALATDDLVLGPACDGGYYLLALHARPEIDDLFTGITMSTPSVCAETVERANRLGRTLRLARKTFDVDEPENLQTLHSALSAAPSAEADPAPATYALLQYLLASTERPEGATLIGAQGGEYGLA